MNTESYAVIERFWKSVEKTTKCWNWMGGLTADGYGQFFYEGKNQPAHRVAYVMAGKTIPDGLTLDHLCRNRRCVNDSHVEPVTRGENVLRGESPVAMNARKTHCIRGHLFNYANTYMQSNGSRRCRKCAAAAQRKFMGGKNERH